MQNFIWSHDGFYILHTFTEKTWCFPSLSHTDFPLATALKANGRELELYELSTKEPFIYNQVRLWEFVKRKLQAAPRHCIDSNIYEC